MIPVLFLTYRLSFRDESDAGVSHHVLRLAGRKWPERRASARGYWIDPLLIRQVNRFAFAATCALSRPSATLSRTRDRGFSSLSPRGRGTEGEGDRGQSL